MLEKFEQLNSISKFNVDSHPEFRKFLLDNSQKYLVPSVKAKSEAHEADIWKVLDLKDCIEAIEAYA